jgi:hypothetical protein
MAIQYAPTDWFMPQTVTDALAAFAQRGTDALTNPYWGFMRNYLNDPYTYITEFGLAPNAPQSVRDMDIYAGDASHPNEYRAVPKGQKPPEGFVTPITTPGWNASKQWPNQKATKGTSPVTRYDWSNLKPQQFQKGGVVQETNESDLLRQLLGVGRGEADRVPIMAQPGEAVIPRNVMQNPVASSLVNNLITAGRSLPRMQDGGLVGPDLLSIYMNNQASAKEQQPKTEQPKKGKTQKAQYPAISGIDTPWKVNSELDFKQYRDYLMGVKKDYPGYKSKEIDDILSTMNMMESGQKIDLSKTKFPAGTILDNGIVFGLKQSGQKAAKKAPNFTPPTYTVPGTPAQPEQFGFVPEGQNLNFNQAALQGAGDDPAKIMQLFMNEAQRWGQPRQMPVTPEGTIDTKQPSMTDQKLQRASQLMGMYGTAQGISPKNEDLKVQKMRSEIDLLNAQAAHYRTLSQAKNGLTPLDQAKYAETLQNIDSKRNEMRLNDLESMRRQMEKLEKTMTTGTGISQNIMQKTAYVAANIRYFLANNLQLLNMPSSDILKAIPLNNEFRRAVTPAQFEGILNDVKQWAMQYGWSPTVAQDQTTPTQATTQAPTNWSQFDARLRQ